MKARVIAVVLLVGIVLSPYIVYANETPISIEAVFITSDKDHSGGIDREELTDYLQTEAVDIDRVHRDFSMMDLNKNGSLTLEEMQVGEEMYPLAFN
jgi:Ca2+-binding EF-hand superfamily protein